MTRRSHDGETWPGGEEAIGFQVEFPSPFLFSLMSCTPAAQTSYMSDEVILRCEALMGTNQRRSRQGSLKLLLKRVFIQSFSFFFFSPKRRKFRSFISLFADGFLHLCKSFEVPEQAM